MYNVKVKSVEVVSVHQAYRYLPEGKDSMSGHHLHSKPRISFSILYSTNLSFFSKDFPEHDKIFYYINRHDIRHKLIKRSLMCIVQTQWHFMFHCGQIQRSKNALQLSLI